MRSLSVVFLASTLLAAGGLAGEPRFWDAVILKTPPEGVKRPGGK